MGNGNSTPPSGTDFLGQKVKRKISAGPALNLTGGAALVIAVRVGGLCELQCPCCSQLIGTYSAIELELSP